MPIQRTPPLSEEGSKEVLRELACPPADTPERRATFERARRAAFLVRRVLEQEKARKTR